MARIEFTNIRNTSGTTVAVTVTSVVAVGKTIVISASSAVASLSAASAADNRPGSTNVYFKDRDRQTTTSGGGHQLRCKVSTQLEIGDVITVTFSVAVSRAPVIVGVFDDEIAAHVVGSLGSAADSGAVTSSVLNSGNFTPGVGDLLVGTVNMVSAGRTFTADAGWSQSTKLVTTAGSGDRGVVQVWRYAAAATPQAASGLFTAGGSALWGIMAEAYALATEEERSGRLWLGDTSYPTLLGGVEYPWSVDGVLSK